LERSVQHLADAGVQRLPGKLVDLRDSLNFASHHAELRLAAYLSAHRDASIELDPPVPESLSGQRGDLHVRFPDGCRYWIEVIAPHEAQTRWDFSECLVCAAHAFEIERPAAEFGYHLVATCSETAQITEEQLDDCIGTVLQWLEKGRMAVGEETLIWQLDASVHVSAAPSPGGIRGGLNIMHRLGHRLHYGGAPVHLVSGRACDKSKKGQFPEGEFCILAAEFGRVSMASNFLHSAHVADSWMDWAKWHLPPEVSLFVAYQFAINTDPPWAVAYCANPNADDSTVREALQHLGLLLPSSDPASVGHHA
jgi:hypothetical protein